MKYKAILFDMDGTVLDTLRDLNAAANTALAEFGFPPMRLDETRRRVGNGSRRLLELALGEGADDTAKVEEYLWKAVNETNAKNPTYKMIKQIFVRHTPLEKNTSNKVVRFRPGNKQGN